MENAQNHSEEWNRRLWETVPGGIVVVAADGSIVQANAEAQRLLALNWDELGRRFVRDCQAQTLWEDGRPCGLDEYPVTRCLQTEQPQPAVTIGVRQAGGQVAWAVHTACPVPADNGGPPAGAVATFIDITDRKKAEEGLREKETHLRLLTEQMPAILWSTDRDLRFTSSTGAGLANLNLEPNDLRGVSLASYFGTEDPEFLPIAAARRALAGESATFEMTWQGRNFHAHVEPFFDSGGECIGTIGVALDITERQRAEEALRESEERHRLLSELTSDYTYTCRVDADGSIHVVAVTDGFTAITGYTLEELNARGGWIELFPPEDRDRRLLEAEPLVANVPAKREVRILTKSGASRWIRYSAWPMWDPEQGRVTRMLGAVQNITDQKRAEDKLREYAEQLQAFSHRLLDAQEQERRHIARELHDEIGQTLTGLKLSLTLLARSARPMEAPLAEIGAQVNKLIAQVRNLSLDLRPGMLDDLGLLPTLAWQIQRYTGQTKVQVAFEHSGLDRRLPARVETAAYRIIQEALTNVARHAGVRAATVRLWFDQDILMIHVEDKGGGFDPQAAVATRTSSGLAGMRERAHLLGGKLTVESAPGAGTRLVAELPVAEAKAVQ
jgi:PAS domain S-box-containing protein